MKEMLTIGEKEQKRTEQNEDSLYGMNTNIDNQYEIGMFAITVEWQDRKTRKIDKNPESMEKIKKRC